MEDGKKMKKLNILYEDNHIIIVEKEPNVLSQSDITKDIDMLTRVKYYIKEKYDKPGNVYVGLLHRLDRPVGGLMIFAKTGKAAKRLTEQIKKKEIKKYYLAVVHGMMKIKSGKMIDYIKKEANGNSIITTKSDGKYSELEYKVLEENKKENKSLIKIKLNTGRHHQIRVQFSTRGHPLCGDQRYGKKDNTQIALYSYKIEFIHPVTKKKIVIENKPDTLRNKYWTSFTM